MSHEFSPKIQARTLAAMMRYTPCLNIFHPNKKRRHLSDQLHHINAHTINTPTATANTLHATQGKDKHFHITMMPTTALELDTQRIAVTLALIMCTAPKSRGHTSTWTHTLTAHDPLSHQLMAYAGDIVAPRDILKDGIEQLPISIERLAHALYLTPEYVRLRLQFHQLIA